MKLVKRIISLLLCIVLCNSISVFAEGQANLIVQYNSQSSKIMINLNSGQASSQMFTITVAANSLPEENYTTTSDYILLKQENTNNSGLYNKEFTIPSNTSSGKYMVTTTLSDGSVLQDTFMHINATEAASALAKLSNSSNLTSVIRTDYAALGVDIDLFNTYASEIAKHYKSFAPVTAPTVSSFVKAYTGALVAASIAGENATSVIKECLKKNRIDLDINLDYFESLSSAVQKDALLKLTKATYANSFKSTYEEIVFLSEVNNAFDWTNYQNIVANKYKSYLSFDLGKYNTLKSPEKVFVNLMGTKYSSKEAFKQDFYTYVNDQYNDENKTKASGGNASGGGGKVSSGVKLPTETQVTDNGGSLQSGNLFKDVSSEHWAYEAISKLAEKDIIHGTDEGMFLPNDFINRAEFSKLIASAFFAKEPYENLYFSDVSDSDWYALSIKKLATNGIVKGTADGKFNPMENITRQDMAVIIMRTLEHKNINLPKLRENMTFEDKDNIATYASDAVQNLYMANIINGVSKTAFEPHALLTRAQASKVIYEVFSLNWEEVN